MTILEAIKNRHAVRNYTDKAISNEIILELNRSIEECNREGNLRMQLITDDKDAFSGFKARLGKFKGVHNYIALVGMKCDDLEENVGYYGERIALTAQQLGLNTCWVAVTYNKRKCKATILENEAMICVLSIGYGSTQGVSHKSKIMEQLCTISDDTPEWFQKGMEAAMLAPTAMNKQDFLFTLHGNEVHIESHGNYAKVDLGILKYHFEKGAGDNTFK